MDEILKIASGVVIGLLVFKLAKFLALLGVSDTFTVPGEVNALKDGTIPKLLCILAAIGIVAGLLATALHLFY